jgi:hypothetical protein
VINSDQQYIKIKLKSSLIILWTLRIDSDSGLGLSGPNFDKVDCYSNFDLNSSFLYFSLQIISKKENLENLLTGSMQPVNKSMKQSTRPMSSWVKSSLEDFLPPKSRRVSHQFFKPVPFPISLKVSMSYLNINEKLFLTLILNSKG